MAEARPCWRRLTTVRARTTAAATAVVGLALAIAAISLVVLLRTSLVQHIDDVADVQAADVAALAAEGALPPTLATAGEDGATVQVVDETGRVIAASAGLDRREPMADFQPAGEEGEARTLDDLPIGDGSTFHVVALRATTPDGPVTIYVAVSLEPVEEAIGIVRNALAVGAPVLLVLVAVTAWIVVGRALRPVDAMRAEVADISERSLDRRVAVPATDDEISRLAGTMNTMLDRLQASADRQRHFVADASHELQTPLASARTDLEVALAHPDRTEWQGMASDLLAANRRMERLVRDLLFLARSDDSAAQAPTQLVDLDDIVVSEAARLRGDGRVPVDTSKVSAAAVRGRRDDMARVVRNLLDNADRYASTAVTLELTSDDHIVTFVVADDGPGVPPADRQRIFERFTRLDDARTRDTGGTGLGLAIAGEIIDTHGGTIAVEDVLRGARFVVRLPSA
ncbi:MAG: ATP-binding protein [Acidimicrobiales bacterium]